MFIVFIVYSDKFMGAVDEVDRVAPLILVAAVVLVLLLVLLLVQALLPLPPLTLRHHRRVYPGSRRNHQRAYRTGAYGPASSRP